MIETVSTSPPRSEGAIELLFDLPVEDSLARTRRRGNGVQDRLDAEDSSFTNVFAMRTSK